MKYFFSAFFLVQENRAWRMTRWWGKKIGDYALYELESYHFRFGMLRDELKDQEIISSSRIA